MEFLKKNWIKLVFGVIALVALIFNIMQYTTLPKTDSADELLNTLGLTVMLLGVLAYLVLSMLDKKKIGAMVLTATGAVTTLLLIISMCVALPEAGQITTDAGEVGRALVNIVAFGLFPVAFGLQFMGVMKDNVAFIVFAILAFIGIIMAFIAALGFVEMGDGVPAMVTNYYNGQVLMAWTMVLAFTAQLVYSIIRRFDLKKIAAIVFIAIAAIAAIMFIVGLCMCMEYVNEMMKQLEPALDVVASADLAKEGIRQLNVGTYGSVMTMLVLGLMPLVLACKKLFKHVLCKKEEVAVAA